MAILLSVCLTLASFVPLRPQDPPSARAPELVDNASLHARLEAIAKAHPECATLLPIGNSRARNMLEVLRLSDGEPPKGRPAIFLVANIDGGQVFSSAVALSHAETLASRYASDAATREFLSRATLYVLPRANPDAAAARFATPLAEVEATGTGVDNDRDRRHGEDPASDVDGDGVIAWMRWKDPEGEWIPDPMDARVMVRAEAKKGQRGEYKLAVEGRDRDRDETPSEDGPLDAVLNQNFPHEWREHAPAAGRFPMDEPEARAIAEFLLAHLDVAVVVTYGTLDTLVEKPKSVADNAPVQKRIPQPGWLESDAGLLAELSKRYGQKTSNKTKGRGVEEGSFQAWAYQHRGLWSLSIPLWDMPVEAKKKEGEPATPDKPGEDKPAEDAAKDGAKDAPKDGAKSGDKSGKKDDPKPSDDVLRMRWMDSAAEGARFLPWKSFEHPELGTVEIGGLKPFARSEPPAGDWAALAGKELDFLMSLGADLPHASIASFEARRLSGGLIEVEAEIVNDSFLPVHGKSAQRTDTARPLRAKLVLPEGAKVIAGSPQTLIRDLGGKGRRELRWLVLCDQPTEIGLKIDSENAGEATAVVEVRK